MKFGPSTGEGGQDEQGSWIGGEECSLVGQKLPKTGNTGCSLTSGAGEPAPSNLARCGIDGSLNSDAGGITVDLQKLKLGDAACDPDGIGGARSRGDWSFPINPKTLIRGPCLGEEGKGWGAHRQLAAAAWCMVCSSVAHSVLRYTGACSHMAGLFVVASIPFLLAAAI